MENYDLSWTCVQNYENGALKNNDIFVGSISYPDEVMVTGTGDFLTYTVSFNAPCKYSAKILGNLLISNYRYLEVNTKFYIVEIKKHVDGTLSIEVTRAESELATPISLDRMRKADGLQIKILEGAIFYVCGLSEKEAESRALSMYQKDAKPV